MKRNLYIALVALLGILVGIGVTSLSETYVINNALAQGLIPYAYSYFNTETYIPPYVLLAILLLGAAGGFMLGHTWWRLVYVERRHWLYAKGESRPTARTGTPKTAVRKKKSPGV